ncbi:MAG: thermonuclease family protein [bacterium]|nr:thermonuclease family protein [bacterium]
MNMRSILQIGGGIVLGILIGVFLVGRTTAPVFKSVSIASPAASAVSTNAPTAAGTYPVVKVVDGDTLAILMNGKSVTLRLIGLDTPETVDPRKPVQCFGKEASEEAKEVLAGKTVRLEMDPSQGELDKYGRTLAYVFLSDGMSFNKYMISEGYGHEYTYNLPYKYQSEFKAAEKQAREEKKGLWGLEQSQSDCSPEPVSPSETGFRADGTHDCSRNTYNCSSFKTQSEAQRVFDLCGGTANDVHKLDSDKDGRVCESLP